MAENQKAVTNVTAKEKAIQDKIYELLVDHKLTYQEAERLLTETSNVLKEIAIRKRMS